MGSYGPVKRTSPCLEDAIQLSKKVTCYGDRLVIVSIMIRVTCLATKRHGA